MVALPSVRDDEKETDCETANKEREGYINIIEDRKMFSLLVYLYIHLYKKFNKSSRIAQWSTKDIFQINWSKFS